MKFVAAAFHAASSFAFPNHENTRREHALPARCSDYSANAKPLSAFVAFGGVDTAKAGEIVQLQKKGKVGPFLLVEELPSCVLFKS